ncbi:MAG: HD domain-containing protein [Gallionellaceae bacterium]|jgi:hypothetical protein
MDNNFQLIDSGRLFYPKLLAESEKAMQNATMGAKEHNLPAAEIRELFVNIDPIDTWDKATQIVTSIHPDIYLTGVRNVFDDVMCLFDGSYPGYCHIQTPYHDLRHTLDVFICAVRILHGVHVSGTPLSETEVSQIMVAALLHDIGYAQKCHESTGSGAQFTQTHIPRGIKFMQDNLANWNLPEDWKTPLTLIIRCTEMNHKLSEIEFPDSRVKLQGQIVGSADMSGQMADRAYLEKLLFLFLEFKEADIGNYKNIHDLLKKTRSFYDLMKITLDGELGGVVHYLNMHFNEWIAINKNYYLESVERNIAYLDKIIQLNESEWLSMLKRHGIVQKLVQINPALLDTQSPVQS